MSVRTSVPSLAVRCIVRTVVATLAALVASLVALAAMPASAQEANSLQSIEPADGASLGASPAMITLVFNQELGEDDQLDLVLACGNQPQATAIPEVDADGLIVTVGVTNPLPRGACTITWFLRDGLNADITNGFSTFSVTTDPPASTGADTPTTTSDFVEVPANPTPAATDTSEEQGSAGGAIWLGRLLSTLGILIVFGALALISVGWPEGPEYVVTVRFLRTVWAVSLVGTVLYLIAFASDFNDTSFGAALSPAAWLDLTDAGWAGRGALLRLVAVVAMGWVAMRPERIIDPTTAMWAWGLPLLGLVAVAMSRVGGPIAPLGYVVSLAHVIAVAVWLGGVALVARVVLAGPGEDDLVQATRSFSRVSIPAILVSVVTGLIQMVRLDGGNVFGSSHGRVLLLKVVVVAAMLFVGLAVRQQVGMRLDRAHEMTVPLADRFRRAFGAEAMLGVVVLAFSGWLLALTPPRIDPLAGERYTREIPFVDQTSGVTATVFIGPSAIGLNGIKVEVEAPEEGITNLVFRFIPPADTDAFVVQQAIPLTGAGTAVLDDSDGLPFTVPGRWTIEMEASTSIGVQQGAQFTFLVDDPDGTASSLPDATSTTAPVDVIVVDQSTTSAPFATTTTVATTTTSTTVPSG